MLIYVKNQRESHWDEIPHFRDSFTEYQRKNLLNRAKTLQYKVSQAFSIFPQ